MSFLPAPLQSTLEIKPLNGYLSTFQDMFISMKAQTGELCDKNFWHGNCLSIFNPSP